LKARFFQHSLYRGIYGIWDRILHLHHLLLTDIRKAPTGSPLRQNLTDWRRCSGSHANTRSSAPLVTDIKTRRRVPTPTALTVSPAVIFHQTLQRRNRKKIFFSSHRGSGPRKHSALIRNCARNSRPHFHQLRAQSSECIVRLVLSYVHPFTAICGSFPNFNPTYKIWME
jgi:hypothetical protein